MTLQDSSVDANSNDDDVAKQLSRVLLFGEAERLTRFRSERDGSDNKIQAWIEIEIEPGQDVTTTAEP